MSLHQARNRGHATSRVLALLATLALLSAGGCKPGGADVEREGRGEASESEAAAEATAEPAVEAGDEDAEATAEPGEEATTATDANEVEERAQASGEVLASDDALSPTQVLEDALGATRRTSARGDYGRFREVDAEAWELNLRSVADTQRAIRAARRGGIVVRMRGRGHSMNGHSIPREGELQLKTEELRSLCRVSEDEVRIGAGVAMVHADRFLYDYGLRLLVRNDGPPGPSVGGYISAGGFGGNSRTHGGLWSQVSSVELVDGRGEVRTFTPEDEAFGYLFGSVGQLGAIVGATMKVAPAPQSPASAGALEVGDCARVPLREEERNDGYFPIHYWWTFMTPTARTEQARAALTAIKDRYADEVYFLPDYTYPIPHFGVHAPIVSPVAGDIAALGIWVRVDEGDVEASRETIEAIEAEVSELAQREGYRRYLSAELSTGPAVWQSNLDDATYQALAALKGELDPGHLFGRGQVFPYDEEAAP